MQITNYTIHTDIQTPLCIAVAADLHDRPCAEVLNSIIRAKPDIIAIPGDLTYMPSRSNRALYFLTEAAKIAPVFYSIGNHENINRDEALLVAKTGAVLLDNSFIATNGIYIGGLSSGFTHRRKSQFEQTPPPDLRWLSRFAALPGFKLLLCHHPEYYPNYIKPLGIDIIISGHAHGGQWRFMGRGVFAPGQGFFPTLTSGVVDDRLIISRGLANTAGVPRFFNQTEFVVVNLISRDLPDK